MPALLTSSVGRSRQCRDGGVDGIGFGDVDAVIAVGEIALGLADIEAFNLGAGGDERVRDRAADAADGAGDDGAVAAKIEAQRSWKS